MGPRLIRDYARAGTVHAIREHTLVPVHMLACVTPFAIAVVWIGAGYAVPVFYPAYVETLPSLRILLVATYLLVVNGGVTTFLFALDKHRRNLLILTPVLAVNVLLDVALVKLGWGLIAVAVGSALTYLIYTLVHLWYVARHFSPSRAEWVRFYVGAFAPGLWTGLVLIALDALLHSAGSAARSAAALAIALLALAPLAFRGVRLLRRLDAMA
jgi:O-antigen/teichoic acid export membrane protein